VKLIDLEQDEKVVAVSPAPVDSNSNSEASDEQALEATPESSTESDK
jgi:hypothetical protein